MKKIIVYIMLFCLHLLCNANMCHRESDTCHRYIHFTNKSGKDIYHKIRIFDEVGSSNPVTSPEFFKVKNNEYMRLINTSQIDCFESWADGGTRNIYLFIFDSQLVEQTPWKTVQQENLYWKKYILTIDSLNNMNWKIIFTGE